MTLSNFLSYRFPRRSEPEIIDEPGVDAELLVGNLVDLERINGIFGGTQLSLWGVDQLLADSPLCNQVTILDLATGYADIPRAIDVWARRRGVDARVVATDYSPQIVRLAAQRGQKRITFAAVDGLRAPFMDNTFDIVMCSLALHHFEPDDAMVMLREMRRIARHGVVVNDIVRSWVGYGGAWLVGRLLSRNPLTRHDGLVSVRRAYTPPEIHDLAIRAGLQNVRIKGLLGYRMALVSHV